MSLIHVLFLAFYSCEGHMRWQQLLWALLSVPWGCPHPGVSQVSSGVQIWARCSGGGERGMKELLELWRFSS